MKKISQRGSVAPLFTKEGLGEISKNSHFKKEPGMVFYKERKQGGVTHKEKMKLPVLASAANLILKNTRDYLFTLALPSQILQISSSSAGWQ